MSATSYKSRAALRRLWRAKLRASAAPMTFREFKESIGWKARVQRGRDPKRHPMMVGR